MLQHPGSPSLQSQTFLKVFKSQTGTTVLKFITILLIQTNMYLCIACSLLDDPFHIQFEISRTSITIETEQGMLGY
jgi:hypothetical protein